MTFSATLDTQAKLVTTVCLFLFSASFVLPFFNHGAPMSIIVPFTIAIIPIILIIYSFLIMSLNYVVYNGNIIIRRRIKTIVLTQENIIDVQVFQRSLLKKQGYIFGVKGFFGYTGKTYLNGVGILRWYGTRKDKTVLITTNDHRNIIITPDEPEAFIKAFSTGNI